MQRGRVCKGLAVFQAQRWGESAMETPESGLQAWSCWAWQEFGFYTKSRFILDTASASCYLFLLPFSITQGSQFPVQTSFQKLQVGRCKAGVCSQLSLCPYPDLTSRPGKLAGTSWWGRGRGNTICCSLLSTSPLSDPHPLL